MVLQGHVAPEASLEVIYWNCQNKKNHNENCFNSIAREVNLISFSWKGQSCLVKQAGKIDFGISAEPLKTADHLHKGSVGAVADRLYTTHMQGLPDQP